MRPPRGCACSRTLPRRLVVAALRKPATPRQRAWLCRAAALVLSLADWAAVRADTLLAELEEL
jgi:hypothetical protein